MKHRPTIAFAVASLVFSACMPFPHRESSPHLSGRVLDRSTGVPISDARVELSGYFTAQGDTGPDGRFDLPAHREWKLVVALGDPGCEVSLQAPNYQEWRQAFFCGYVPLKDALLTPLKTSSP
jgi:hypothetical protein